MVYIAGSTPPARPDGSVMAAGHVPLNGPRRGGEGAMWASLTEGRRIISDRKPIMKVRKAVLSPVHELSISPRKSTTALSVTLKAVAEC